METQVDSTLWPPSHTFYQHVVNPHTFYQYEGKEQEKVWLKNIKTGQNSAKLVENQAKRRRSLHR